jgi:hypothetical protein
VTKEQGLGINERTRPVFSELTDEVVEMCEREPNNIMMRMARTMGLPEGVDPEDSRILELFEVTT